MKNLLKLLVLSTAAAVLVLYPGSPAFSARKTIGVVMTGDIPYYKSIHREFRRSFPGLGGVDIVLQTPSPEPMSWTNSVRKLIALGSDVIISYGAPATLTAMKETSSIPIVFAGVYDPEAMRIMGRNATGISSKVSIKEALRNLKSVSSLASLGVVFARTEKDTILQVREIKQLEGSMGFRTVLFDAKKKGFAAKVGGVDALLLTTSCAAMCNVDDIISAARKARVPTAATIGGAEHRGVIFTTMAAPAEQGSVIAGMTARVLKGEAPSSIPLARPRRVEFIINSKEAGAMGISIPQNVMASATRVIK